MRDKANKLREAMARRGVEELVRELAAIPDERLLASVAQHVKIKVKIF